MMEEKTPIKAVWRFLSIPLSALGLLSLSDSLINFHQNIQNLIDSYHAIVYPIFDFLFSWAWFEIPSYVNDYLFIGVLYTSSEVRTRGLGTIHYTSNEKIVSLLDVLSPTEIRMSGVLNTIGLVFRIARLRIPRIVMSILMWPLWMLGMARRVGMSDANGMVKGTNLAVKYLRREGDIFVFRYLGAVVLVFIVALIVNYSLFMAT